MDLRSIKTFSQRVFIKWEIENRIFTNNENGATLKSLRPTEQALMDGRSFPFVPREPNLEEQDTRKGERE